MTPAAPESFRRSDAERNRERILAAARIVLANRSGEVSMAEVARRAGVGMATLYRNYPGRRELLEGLYAKEVDDLCRAADEASGPAGEVLDIWLRQFVVFHENKHPIAAELLRHTDRADPVFETSRDRVLAAGRPLLIAAQQAGETRTDLAIDQVLDLVLAVVTVPGDRTYVEPILCAALDGLRRWASRSAQFDDAEAGPKVEKARDEKAGAAPEARHRNRIKQAETSARAVER